MINDNFKIEKKEATFAPLPEDKYQVELLDIELKDATGKFAQAGEKNFSFTFALLNGEDEKANSLRGRLIWANFVPTFFQVSAKAKKWPGKNELYRIVEALTKQPVTDELIETFNSVDLNTLIGKQCVIFIKNTPSNQDPNKIFSNIVNYIATKTDLTPLSDDEKNTKDDESDTTVNVNGIDIAGEEVPGVPSEELKQEALKNL